MSEHERQKHLTAAWDQIFAAEARLAANDPHEFRTRVRGQLQRLAMSEIRTIASGLGVTSRSREATIDAIAAAWLERQLSDRSRPAR